MRVAIIVILESSTEYVYVSRVVDIPFVPQIGSYITYDEDDDVLLLVDSIYFNLYSGEISAICDHDEGTVVTKDQLTRIVKAYERAGFKKYRKR